MCSADQTTRSANVWYLLSYLLRWIFNRREEVAAGDKSRLEEGERWIVITSINYPTPSVERLNELPGWQVLVVADKKTPADWALKGVKLLTVEEQERLSYKTSRLTPWNSYARKNIGYLYAIEHGAKVIYETDDDNQLYDDIPELPSALRMNQYVPAVGGDASVTAINVYATFGLERLWPRGFPLADVAKEVPRCFEQTLIYPWIQQGLADKDPDVDAIARLTTKGGLFDKKMVPVAIPHGYLTPFNSQNTLFKYEALWAMLIPVSTTFRVCDIWRGYFAQRLLWEVGGHLTFLPPSVFQDRNSHNLIADLIDEVQLYTDAGRLVQFLRSWTPGNTTLPAIARELAAEMAARDFWGPQDVDLVDAWVTDLTDMGYQWPPVVARKDRSVLGSEFGVQPVTEVNQTAVALYENSASNLVDPLLPSWWCKQPDIILVIMYKKPAKSAADIALLDRAYRPMFHKVIHTGYVSSASQEEVVLDAALKDITWVDCQRAGKGHLTYECFSLVMQTHKARPNGGYLFLGEDAVFNPCVLCSFNLDKIWAQEWRGHEELRDSDQEHYTWFQGRGGETASRDAFLQAMTSLKSTQYKPWNDKFVDSTGRVSHWIYPVLTDMLYIPERLARRFVDLASYFRQHGVFTETAVAQILAIMNNGTDNIQDLKGFWSHGERQNEALRKAGRLTTGGVAEGRAVFHPLKLSNQKDLFLTWWSGVNCKLASSGIASQSPAETCALQRTLPSISLHEDLGI